MALKLGVVIGVIRDTIELGCTPSELQIGGNHQVISPKLYIAFGISGSDHHLAGIRYVRSIVAVNTDKNVLNI